jgi:hypothetical protein
MPSIIVLLLVVVAACSSPAASAPDAATTADAAPCESSVAATIGAAGGAVEHCDGARLTVPAGVLAGEVELSITRVAVEPAPGAPYVATAGAFRFAGPEGLTLGGWVGIEVPHGGAEPRGRVELAALGGEGWAPFESCPPGETTIRQDVGFLGTFAALLDPTPYAESTLGLGEGSIDYQLGGVGTGALSVDPHGLAIDYDLTTAGRVLTVVYRRNDENGLVQIQLDFSIEADGTAVPVAVAWADTSVPEIWSNDVFLHPEEMDIRVTSDVDGTITGELDAQLYEIDHPTPRALAATFTARPEHYRYPPDRACGPGGGE